MLPISTELANEVYGHATYAGYLHGFEDGNSNVSTSYDDLYKTNMASESEVNEGMLPVVSSAASDDPTVLMTAAVEVERPLWLNLHSSGRGKLLWT